LWCRGKRTRASQPAQENEALFVHQKGHRVRCGNEMMSSRLLDLNRSFATTHDPLDARTTVWGVNSSLKLKTFCWMHHTRQMVLTEKSSRPHPVDRYR
jgi:hypothetical protein